MPCGWNTKWSNKTAALFSTVGGSTAEYVQKVSRVYHENTPVAPRSKFGLDRLTLNVCDKPFSRIRLRPNTWLVAAICQLHHERLPGPLESEQLATRQFTINVPIIESPPRLPVTTAFVAGIYTVAVADERGQAAVLHIRVVS